MTHTSDKFSAAAPAAGYIYQARLALAVALRFAYAQSGVDVAVERLDDISFEENGSPFELLQTKHHIDRSASLGDSSPDLWKSLRIWCEAAKADPGLPNKVQLVLVTTSLAIEGQAAWLLRADDPASGVTGRNAKAAAELLTTAAESSHNKALAPAFEAFLALDPRMRASLLSAVQVLDGQPLLGELEAAIEHQIRMAVPRNRLKEAREQLEGWWWGRVCTALLEVPAGLISVSDIEVKIDEIRESMDRAALVADLEHADPTDEELSVFDGLRFVRQLRLVGVGGNRVEHAKRDFYRAFAQRSKWTREHVVLDEELAVFEKSLIEEWQPRYEQMVDAHASEGVDSQNLKVAGQELYHWVETEARFPLRQLIKRFLNVGSFHILANDLRVGWHRDFKELCQVDQP